MPRAVLEDMVDSMQLYSATYLYILCYTGHAEMVKMLLDEDFDVIVQGGEYGTALQAACYKGHV